jgi:hypothetical protein
MWALSLELHKVTISVSPHCTQISGLNTPFTELVVELYIDPSLNTYLFLEWKTSRFWRCHISVASFLHTLGLNHSVNSLGSID